MTLVAECTGCIGCGCESCSYTGKTAADSSPKSKQSKFYGLMLSPNIEKTVEGYLVCKNVPICRSGAQEYLGKELVGFPGYEESWDLDPDKRYNVIRPENEVLDPDTIRSFEGKTVVDEHPESEGNVVRAENERDLHCGHIQNIREGPRLDGKVTLMGDIIIKDPILIDKVRPESDPDNGIREVSCGYTLKLGRKKDGSLYMYDIRGNHVAVVPTGRAGPRFAIKDSAPPEIKPKRGSKMNLLDRILGRGLQEELKDASPEELAELSRNLIPDSGKTVTVHAIDSKPKEEKEESAADKDPHRMAAHSCLDRCMDAMKHEKGMGVDAFGKAVGIDALKKELMGHLGGDSASDEKPEELEEEEAAGDKELEQEEKTAAEEKDKTHNVDSGPAPEHEIDDPGESVLKAANDATRAFIKSTKPIVAEYITIPKSRRTSSQQALIDSYNGTVRLVNKAGGQAYSNLNKTRIPDKISTLATDSTPKSDDVDVTSFFEGVPFAEGQKRLKAHQDTQKGKK